MCIQCIYANLDWQVDALSASTPAIASRSCARRSAGKQEGVRLVSKAARRQSTRWWSIKLTEACGGPRRVPGTSRGREARPSTCDLAPTDTNVGFVLAKIRLEPRCSLKFPRRPSPLGVGQPLVAVDSNRRNSCMPVATNCSVHSGQKMKFQQFAFTIPATLLR